MINNNYYLYNNSISTTRIGRLLKYILRNNYNYLNYIIISHHVPGVHILFDIQINEHLFLN